MGLFTRRRTDTAEVEVGAAWRYVIESYREVNGRAADVDDDGQALQAAFTVAFGRADEPDARIDVWVYPSYETRGRYGIGFRYDYTSGNHPNWRYAMWTNSGSDIAFDDPEDAWRHAEIQAHRLVEQDPDLMAALDEVFNWDGVPWRF